MRPTEVRVPVSPVWIEREPGRAFDRGTRRGEGEFVRTAGWILRGEVTTAAPGRVVAGLEDEGREVPYRSVRDGVTSPGVRGVLRGDALTMSPGREDVLGVERPLAGRSEDGTVRRPVRL